MILFKKKRIELEKSMERLVAVNELNNLTLNLVLELRRDLRKINDTLSDKVERMDLRVTDSEMFIEKFQKETDLNRKELRCAIGNLTILFDKVDEISSIIEKQNAKPKSSKENK